MVYEHNAYDNTITIRKVEGRLWEVVKLNADKLIEKHFEKRAIYATKRYCAVGTNEYLN